MTSLNSPISRTGRASRMCGIFGLISQEFVSSSDVLKSLKRLEYRGYDSYGIATDTGLFEKDIGEIKLTSSNNCNIAISQTRWATHGGVTKENAHPHHDCTGNVLIVHNGIIENYAEIKENLQALGHNFYSETDSEVIAHYFEEGIKAQNVEETISDFFNEAKGTFSVLLFIKGSDKLYAFKRDSPLAIGIGNKGFFIASDPYAFSQLTQDVVFLEDDEYVVLTKSKFSIFDKTGKELFREKNKIELQKEESRGKYEHFMLKEIHEQPESAEKLLKSLETQQKENLLAIADAIKKSQKTIFVASGTSYYASLLGVYFLKKAGIESQAMIASEFKDYANCNEALVIALSQSGETMDVIDALKHAKQRSARIASFVNVPYSTIQRMSDLSLQTEAGQEICVASTKSFSNQIILLLTIAKELGYKIDLRKIAGEIRSVFALENGIRTLAHGLKDKHDIYIIGRGLSYPVSREIALKLKEISYIHAEGMMGGELKHGTLALIEKETPVIALIDNNESIVSNVREAQARGADIIAITNRKERLFREEVRLQAESDASFAILAAIVGQLLAYYIAKEKGLPIDKPRNLAKSVTVK